MATHQKEAEENGSASKKEVSNARSFGPVTLSKMREAREECIAPWMKTLSTGIHLQFSGDSNELQLREENGTLRLQLALADCEEMLSGERTLLLYVKENAPATYLLTFKRPKELMSFHSSLISTKQALLNSSDGGPHLKRRRQLIPSTPSTITDSDFNCRTEASSAQEYFRFYSSLLQQQNMMQDYQRTATYQRALQQNSADLRDKVVLDVGAGSGLLSFFAAQAGAKRIYAVEASSMADHCRELVRANGLADRIRVVEGKVEEVTLPEQVDVIISEPMGYMLLNERMLESFVHARRFLKEDGIMFPTRGDLHLALFSDDALHLEQMQRCMFWAQTNFHGIDLSALKQKAVEETFHQPVVDTWHPGILISGSHRWRFDFEKDSLEKLQRIDIPFELMVTRSAHLHGIASWFDVAFIGSEHKIWLSTAPSEPLTHWYQVRLLLQTPVMVHSGQTVTGRLLMVANDKQSYDVRLEVSVNGTTSTGSYDLKSPNFRYNGQPVMPPSGSHKHSPSNYFLQQQHPTGAAAAANGKEQCEHPPQKKESVGDIPLPSSNNVNNDPTPI